MPGLGAASESDMAANRLLLRARDSTGRVRSALGNATAQHGASHGTALHHW
eukprot:COSAG06_NODE_3304_length_5531_cov_144.098306_7_plen_51_part_00